MTTPGTDIARALYERGHTNDTLAHCDVQQAIDEHRPATCASVAQVRVSLARLCGDERIDMDGRYDQIADRCPFCQCHDADPLKAHNTNGAVRFAFRCINCGRVREELYRFDGLHVRANQ